MYVMVSYFYVMVWTAIARKLRPSCWCDFVAMVSYSYVMVWKAIARTFEALMVV